MKAIARNTRRATVSIEYVLLGSLMAIAAVVAISNVSSGVSDSYEVPQHAISEVHAAWGGAPAGGDGAADARSAAPAPAAPRSPGFP